MCALNLGVPDQKAIFKPRILVLGVGGAGGNAVNNMIQADLQGVEFAVTNTDAQALEMSLSDRRVRLGTMATQGLGAGANPMVGRAAAEESLQDVLDEIGDVNMVFITAGMGGGTGTGAAPLIAKALKERGVLTVGVATKPFAFEGVVRMRQAEEGIDLFASTVDTLIVIPNENLFRIANENTSYADALKMADEVLYDGVRAISDLIVRPGNINLDFADVRALMTVMGKSMMGTGEADGENRALDAAERAIKNPLLDDVNLKSAKGVLLNISGGPDLTMYEVDEAAKRITREVMPESNIITGTSIDPSLDGTVRVSVVATGIDEELGQQEATPTNGFARQELGLAPSAAAPVKPTPIAPPAPATNVASKGRGGAFTIGSGTGGVIHTIQGVPGSMEFARAVANPPKPAAEPTPAPQAVEAADAPVMEKPRNPIAPLPETLLTPPARNELMDMREAYNSQSAAQATQHREEVAAAPVSAPVPASAPAPAVAQAAEPAPQPSNLMTAQARAEQARQELAAPAAPAVAAAEPQLFEPLGGRDDPFAGMEEPARNEARAETSPEPDQTARPSGALGFLKGLARGGFSKATTAQDVHEAEERERRVRENGFDRLARPAFKPDGPAEPVATRGLNGPGQQPALTNLSTTPTGVDPLDVDESEINIPAFLRRQMN
ncbi:MAG: cell division protein FtsZ [Geminicoccus sp.]|nr:cell division protein FtsZ [Geminicoccus sp.]HCH99915.1 cell division protein FtsZ [Alphaproteobacteria bacterium]